MSYSLPKTFINKSNLFILDIFRFSSTRSWVSPKMLVIPLQEQLGLRPHYSAIYDGLYFSVSLYNDSSVFYLTKWPMMFDIPPQ